MIDQELFNLASHSLPDTIMEIFTIVGISAAMVSFLIFMVWAIFQVVRFIRKILQS